MTWKKGPPPPGTYNWGGVVLVGKEPSGFYFAEFRGDHVVIDPHSDKEARLSPEQVAYYSDCLRLPIEEAKTVLRQLTLSKSDGEGILYNTPIPDGFSTGLVIRDYDRYPTGYLSFAPEFPDDELIDESEWPDRLAQNRATKSGLLDLREAYYEILKSLDQDGLGLCWAFSSTKATMYTRALMNASFLRLSAWYVAGIINRWRDQGGWGAASLEFIRNTGVPAESYCPSYKSSYDTADTRANAALHKVTEWWDGTNDPRKATKQLVSSLLKRIPCVVDLNDMGHSMCAIDIGSLNPLEIIYDNSWGESGEKGLYRGRGARSRPDGLVIPRVSLPSPV